MPNKQIESRLSAARIFIDNVLADPEIFAAFEAVGRGTATFEAGRALYERAFRLYLAQEREYVDRRNATDDVHRAVEEADVSLQRHLDWARFLASEDERLDVRCDLGPVGVKPRGEWLTRATDFYEVILADPAWVSAMERYGNSREELQQGRDDVAAIFDLLSVQARENGEAKGSTTRRDAAVEEVHTWLREHRRLAELLLADAPEKLEELGIRTRRYRRRRTAASPEEPPPVPPASTGTEQDSDA